MVAYHLDCVLHPISLTSWHFYCHGLPYKKGYLRSITPQKEISYEKRDPFPSWTASTWYKSCTFVAWMCATPAKVKEFHFFTRLNQDFWSDIAWWHTFIQCWNGLSMLHKFQFPFHMFTIHTDASGSLGCRAFINGQWLQWEWPRGGLHRVSWQNNLYR